MAVLACGIVTLVWRGSIFIEAIGLAQCVGGITIFFNRTAKAGAVVIGIAYLVLSLLSVPQMVAKPQIYASWGNFFYPFSVVVGAALIVARSSRVWEALFGVCAASFGIEQVEFLGRTASLVPKWIPPSQMFWAITTCAPFALVAVALITNRAALLATRLFALMFLLFCVLVWIPILISAPHVHGNWVEASETFAIAGAAWVLADVLASRAASIRPRSS